MDVHDFTEQFKRYCKSHTCVSCPINGACPSLPSDGVIRTVIRWGEDHPKPTNAEKIRELFGVDVFPSTVHPGYFCINGTPGGDGAEWLNSEYKEK